MKTPIDFEQEIGEGNDIRQLTAIGRFGVAIAVFIALLLFIPNPVEGRLAILVLALVIGGVSGLRLKQVGNPLSRETKEQLVYLLRIKRITIDEIEINNNKTKKSSKRIL